MRKMSLGLLTLSMAFSAVGLCREYVSKPPHTAGDVKDSKVTVSGHIESLPYNNHPYFNTGFISTVPFRVGSKYTQRKVHIDEKGDFTLSIESIKEPMHVEIEFIDGEGKARKGAGLIGGRLLSLFVEPGDNIQINADWNRLEDTAAHSSFSGKGSGKFKCLQELAVAKIEEKSNDSLLTILRSKDWSAANWKLTKWLLEPQLAILNKYKSQMSDEAYQLLRADIEGRVFVILAEWFAPNAKDDAIGLEQKQKAFSELHALIKKYKPIPMQAICLSQEYLGFFLNNEKTSVCFAQRTREADFIEVYNRLKTNYSGLLREKLIAWHLLDQERGAVSVDDYAKALTEALTIVKTNYLRAPLEYKERFRRGADPYDFEMPVDSSNKMLKLSDLKGNVVLVDMYSDPCCGCAEFAETFHKKVYPLFKDDPHFKVVSIFGNCNGIMASMANFKNAMAKHIFCSPEYINLFGGDGVEKGALQFRQYYQSNSVPIILLIDKKGKIICTSVTSFPVCTDPNSPEVQQLIDLIKGALNESDITKR